MSTASELILKDISLLAVGLKPRTTAAKRISGREALIESDEVEAELLESGHELAARALYRMYRASLSYEGARE